jgi:ferredoxin
MMIRKLIAIDREKCDGCGLCISACHEGAIGIREGKAVLLREDYCDGLGNCLPACPAGAIGFEEREAAAFVDPVIKPETSAVQPVSPEAASAVAPSRFKQWPIQIKLVPVKAPYFEDAQLLVAADCAAYAYGNFHPEYMQDKITLIGCPKLDGVDYAEKLGAILQGNAVKSVTVVRMEVPCCGGIEHAAITALKNSGKTIPCQVFTISIDGRVLD